MESSGHDSSHIKNDTQCPAPAFPENVELIGVEGLQQVHEAELPRQRAGREKQERGGLLEIERGLAGEIGYTRQLSSKFGAYMACCQIWRGQGKPLQAGRACLRGLGGSHKIPSCSKAGPACH